MSKKKSEKAWNGTIHYSLNGSDIQQSIWTLCHETAAETPEFDVTKDMSRVNCDDCKVKMPLYFSLIHKNPLNLDVTVIANIIAATRVQAIQVVVHFIDNGELRTLDGDGVNFMDCMLVQSTTATYMN